MLLSMAAYAADWPQWRGPLRNAVSTETGLLLEWPKEGPRLVWQAKDIGDGYATPSVAGNRIYVLTDLPLRLAHRSARSSLKLSDMLANQ
jgi:hypothetical protein